MTIKKLKRKSISWIDAKIWQYANIDRDLEDFWKFECSEFFRGEITAELNREYYYKRKSFVARKVRQLKLLKQNVYGTKE